MTTCRRCSWNDNQLASMAFPKSCLVSTNKAMRESWRPSQTANDECCATALESTVGLFMLMLKSRYVPRSWTTADVIMWSVGMVKQAAQSFRLISSLSVVSKLLKRLIAPCLLKYLTVNNLYHSFSRHVGLNIPPKLPSSKYWPRSYWWSTEVIWLV